MKIYCLVVTVLLSWTTNPLAQHSFKQVDVGLAAPDAAEIAKYGNLEVSLFKGVPNVTVPIHTLEVNDFSLPVFLSYDAGGIKVDQIATNAGLGWSLHAGGQITVAAYGKDDFLEPVESFVQSPSQLQAFDPNEWVSGGSTAGKDDYDKAWDMYNPTFGGIHKNLKPDLFYYNFAGNNGKFVIKGDINNSFSHYTVPYRKLKISYSGSTGFEIIDESGNTFIFDELDIATLAADQNNCHGGPGSSGGNATPIPASKLWKEARTWHLGKIITSSGDEIDFTYDASQTQYTYTENHIEQKYERVAPVSECMASINDYNCSTNKTISPKRISSIVHANSGRSIEFIYAATARQDFGNSTYTALDSIVVKLNGQEVKAFDLDTDSYFGTGSAKRLKLSGVKQKGYPAGYTFEYNPGSLPARLSKSQDHWGFYNGKSNSTLVPGTYVSGGGDRSVDPSKAGNWSLQRINYPAGGSTILDMEGIPTGGGIRVKSMYDINGMGDTTGTRHFDYVAANAGNFNYVDFYEYYLESDYTSGGGASCGYDVFTSSHIPAVQTMDNPDYGFSKVTITYDQDGSSGKTEHYFSKNLNDLSAVSLSDPGALRWGRGEMIKTVQYNSAGNKISEQKNTFKVHKTENGLWGSSDAPKENYIYGVHIQLKRPELTYGAGGTFNIPYTYPARFEVQKFRVISAWYHPDSTVTSVYDPSDNTKVLTNREKREYDDASTQLSRLISTNSDGDVRQTEYRYASQQYPGMSSRHMLSQPYEVVTKDASGNTLRIDWTLWKEFALGSKNIWKPCSRWAGGPGLSTTGEFNPPDDPDCN